MDDAAITAQLQELLTPQSVPEEAAQEPAEAAEAAPPEATEAAPVEQEEPPQRLSKTREVLERAKLERERRKAQADQTAALEAAKNAARDELLAIAKRDPARFYREVVGLAPEKLTDVAAPLYYEHLGDQAPETLKQRNRDLALERQIELIRAENEELKRSMDTREQEREVRAYLSQVSAFAEGRADDYPFLAAQLEHDAENTLDALRQEAARFLQETGNVASPKQIAQSIESALEMHYLELEKAAKRRKQPATKMTQTATKSTSETPSSQQLHDAPSATGGWSREQADREVEALFSTLR